MGSTFLVLTNKLMRRLNEVELTSGDFASARNVGATAKDSIIAALAEINTSEIQWPWNKQTGSAYVEAGTQEVVWGTANLVGAPSTVPVSTEAVPDWHSFKIQGPVVEDPPGTFTVVPPPRSPLRYLNREQWLLYARELDENSVDSGGRGRPDFVFPSVGGFGVTPMPEQGYVIEYEMYITPTELNLHGDVNPIPTVWDYVIINMALKYYYMFKDNAESTQLWMPVADKSFARMKYAFVNRPDYVYSHMINPGATGMMANWDGYIDDAR